MATPALSLSHRHVSAFAADVRESLTKPGQRELPSKYLYDEVGSALFETICVLPEYGLTRADARLLEKYAGEIVGRLPSPIQVAELGSGSGKKTRWILEALSRRQKTYYYPIEISPSALAALAKELGQIDMVSIVGYEQPYLEGLRAVAEGRDERDNLLVLFLGSTIGNFDRDAGEAFLREMRAILQPGDRHVHWFPTPAFLPGHTLQILLWVGSEERATGTRLTKLQSPFLNGPQQL